IVIDDASTDKTGIIAEQYSRIHPYILVVRRDKEEGGRGKASAYFCSASIFSPLSSFFHG
ncbi:MAG: hypothetical protein QXH03_01230, partial [Candidatus Bathyarchaeia archaeon]